jgi:hypothetical protein
MNVSDKSDKPALCPELPTKTSNWDYPKPFAPLLAPETPYPINALPALLQKAVSTYQQYGQQPLAMVACGALANLSLACQSMANVARDRYLVSPVSLYFMLVAASGERKTACDGAFSKPCRQWEAKIREQREPKIQTALILHQAWQMERDGLLNQIKRSMNTGIDSDFYKDLLERLVHLEPEIPLHPTLYFEDATQEALAIHLANGWPSASLWSDEAGIVLGSHSMQSNPTRFVALLNRLWDGKSLSAHRKTTQSFVIKNRRLTLNLMMQPLLLQQMSAQTTGINRQSGFLARCLMAYPTSSMGKRFYQEPPDSLECLDNYGQRITECLKQSERLTHAGCIQLPTLCMDTAAKQVWTQFFNGIESGLSSQGQWSGIKDFASKAAENVARLAALFHLFEGKTQDIGAENMEQAIAIINWHLQETRRLLAPATSTGVSTDATKLTQWLISKGYEQISLRDIQRLSPLRDKQSRDEAIDLLVEHQMVKLTKIDGKSVLEINPHLL